MVVRTLFPVFCTVLVTQASPGPDREFLALWEVFWGAEFEFEVRFSKFGRLGHFFAFSIFRAVTFLSIHSMSSVTYRDGMCVRQNLGLQKGDSKTFQTAQNSSKSDTI